MGRRIDESSPMVDARLPDGSRVNVIIPPLALNGPVLPSGPCGRSWPARSTSWSNSPASLTAKGGSFPYPR
ncbi:MAG: hypothetical protein SV487_08145 [Thermodesulfobacteriota bacterium]|nr:hypothetical protein [Thermodesulfobacteriota bacterium]